MRVYRLEVDKPRASMNSSHKNLLREERVGIFCAGKAPGRLYNMIPFPVDEFEGYVPHENHFFAFPDTAIIDAVAPELADDDMIDGDMYPVLIAVYEVSPLCHSESQVVFDKNTAQFIEEIKFRDYLTDMRLVA